MAGVTGSRIGNRMTRAGARRLRRSAR